MKLEPKFSVIIAVYNGAKTIARAIESVLAQTYPAFEIIVVDDGSTDKTSEIVYRYKDSVRYFFQCNAGVSSARNKGAKMATGEWLVFLDADDYYYEDRLSRHAERIQRDPNLDFLTGNFDYRRPDGSLIRRSMESTEIGNHLLSKSRGKNKVVMEGVEIGCFVEEHFGDTHTLSIPRTKFLELGGYPLTFEVCEDVHLLVRLCAKSRRVGVICKPTAAYIIHDNSATRRDPLYAQKQTVEALVKLRKEISNARSYVVEGLEASIRRARLSLSYELLRSDRSFKAVLAILPQFIRRPGLKSLRDILSIMRGF